VLLAALFGPVVLATLVAGIGGAVLEADPKIAPYVDLFLLAQIPLVIAAFGALAVALGRWIPSPVAAPVFLVAQVVTGAIWLVNWAATTSSGIRVGMHLAYLVGIIVFSSTVALVRDRRTPLRIVVSGLAIALVVVSAILQIPPGGYR
jgi:hypothetical protein